MPSSCARTILSVLSIWAAMHVFPAGNAGELTRPVPSDAQVTRFTRFNIRYTLRDIVAEGVRKVDFHISDDMGGTWRHYGEDADRTSPMTVEVPGEGVYGFVCVVTDRFGNREREPGPRTRPETVIVVDRTPPTAKWLAPSQDILGRGQAVEFSWESADDYFGDAPVTLQYAANAQGNHDRNANWQPIRENLPAVGTFSWTPPGSARYNFRLVAEDRAGNAAVAYSAATVRVDNAPPLITGIQPLRSNKLTNDIIVEATDNEGGAGVKEYSLYVSDNGSATWTLVKENAGGESLPVKRPSGGAIAWTAPRAGEYPLWPVVFDEAGNATPLPSIAVAGPYILTIDDQPPQVTLSNSFLMGRAAVLANETRRVEWTSYDPHMEEGSGAIHLSLDNGATWRELRNGLPANGFETINFPFGEQSEEARLKVTVADAFGNTGESVSETFKLSEAETTIDSVTPRGASGAAPAAPAPAAPYGGGTGVQPAPTSPLPSFPGFTQGGGAGFDPYGGGAGMYGPPADSAYSGESTAGSLPRAMLDGSSASGGIPMPGGYAPPPPGGGLQDLGGAAASRTDSGWQPSPGSEQARAPLAPIPGSDSGASAWDALQASSATPSGAGAPADSDSGFGAWTSSGSGDAGGSGAGGVFPDQWQSSPGQSSPAVAAAAPPASAESPFAVFGGDPAGSSAAPPPASTAQQTEPLSLPAFSSDDTGGLSLDGFGGGSVTDGIGLPGASFGPDSAVAPPALPPSSSLSPPSPTPDVAQAAGQQPVQQPWPATTDAMPPVVQSAQPPGMPSLDGPAADSGLSLPQPLEAQRDRPVDQRQASEHYVRESRAFRDEGRPDLALESARKAVESDPANAAAFMELSQVNARMVPPDHVTAANLAKEATNLRPDWETWWNCADVFYIWANASNREIQAMQRQGQTPPMHLVDERNSTLSNANIAVNNAASVLPRDNREAAKKVAVTQGMIAYQRALAVPEPYSTGATEGPAADEYRSRQGEYKATVAPLLQEAMPYFRNALSMGGPPEYNETFQLGIINFRLAGLERDTGNAAQAATNYQDAVTYLEQATTAANAPKEGPREAYYMLALCHDQLSAQPSANRARHRELALRYWRQTADFYDRDSPYRAYAEQRIEALSEEMGL